MQKMKTRCYYTDYVNHMIRFFLTCPNVLDMRGKKRADVENWVAVQGVLHMLPEEDSKRVLDIYKTHYNLPKAVDLYCQQTGADSVEVWVLLTKVAASIAKRRGLS